MFTAVVGHSEDLDSLAAAEDVLAQCKAGLDGRTPTAGLLFSAIDFDHQVCSTRSTGSTLASS